jgi:hypothetical protein
MGSEIQFGRVLERSRQGRLVWLLVVPAIVAIAFGGYWALSRVSAADSVADALRRSQEQVAAYQRSLEERDRLLEKAHADEALLSSPGQAVGIFYRSATDATESGVVIADPARHTARLFLHGLVSPPTGREYVVIARPRGGSARLVGRVVADELGEAFVLAKDLPEGTSVVELAWATREGPPEDAITRVAARYPASRDERGVLVQQGVQARRGKQ